jgi:polysaccharide biosynthesis transport protein
MIFSSEGSPLAFVRRNLMRLFVFAAVPVLAALFFLARTPPYYTAETLLYIDGRKLQLQPQPIVSDAPIDSGAIDSQAVIVKSDAVLLTAVRALHLAEDSESSTTGSPSISSKWLGKPSKTEASALEALKGNLVTARVALAYVIRISYRDTNPERAARIADGIADAYIATQVHARAQAAQDAGAWLHDRLEALQQQIAEADGRVRDFKERNDAAAQAKFDRLQNDVETYRRLYASLLQRYADAVQQESLPIAEARVASRALVPTKKSGPAAGGMLAGALFTGLSLGLAFCLWRERTDRTARLPEPLADGLGIGCVAVVPRVRNRTGRRRGGLAESAAAKRILQVTGPHAYALAEPDSGFARAIWGLKIAVDGATAADKTPVVLGIASLDERIGKSVIAANLARILARAGAPVLLVDADVHRRSLSNALTPGAQDGLLSAGDIGLDEATWTDLTTKMRFLPLGQRSPDPLAVFDPLTVFDRLTGLRHLLQPQGCRYAVVALPSFGSGLDARTSAAVADRLVLVVEWGKSNIDAVENLLDRIPGLRDKLIAVALNKTDPAAMRRFVPAYRGDVHFAAATLVARDPATDGAIYGARRAI